MLSPHGVFAFVPSRTAGPLTWTEVPAALPEALELLGIRGVAYFARNLKHGRICAA